jgi:outer membrane protein OmpA-like peptidoglycan-associated protein
VKIQGATDQEKTLTRTLEMRKIAVGVTSILRNLYFDYDRASFKTESYTELNKLESMLRQNASMKVEIGGHTDAYGNWNYNKNLSQKRAEAVKDYLTRKGIDARRIKAVGYGETKPLASNDDEDEGRELNRRVEFKVLQN